MRKLFFQKWTRTIFFAEIPEKLLVRRIFFDLLRISANIKAAQISLHRLRRLISKVQILSFGLFRLPWGCGADGDGGRTDPVFFGDVLDVAVVDVYKAAAV